MSNTTTITGNLTREPEIRYTREGQATAQLGVAVSRRWQDRTTQEWQEATSFFDVVCWRDLAENVALSLSKGMRVVVTGRIEQRSWETDEGEHRSKVEIVADEIGPIPALHHRRRAAGRAPGGCRDIRSGDDEWPRLGRTQTLQSQQPRLSRGCCASGPRRRAGRAASGVCWCLEAANRATEGRETSPHPHHPTSAARTLTSAAQHLDHLHAALYPSRPRCSQATTLPSLSSPISHISLLHTCGIRGGSGLPEGADGGRPPISEVRDEGRPGEGSRP